MDCQEINREDLAEKYLRHRLEEAQVDEFETHLLECPTCARELELLQTVQTDLAERAHEIRGWTASRPHFFRWQIVVLAGVVIAVAAASIVIRWQKMQTASVTAPPPPKAHPPTEASVAAEHAPDAPGGPSAINNMPIQRSKKPKTNEKNPPVPGQGGTPAQLAATNSAGQNAPVSGVPVDNGGVVDRSAADLSKPQEVAAANSQPGAEPASMQPQLTTEQGVELYKLAAVVPPPYTFSGLVSKGKLPDAHDKGKYSSGSTPSDTGRQLFQNAMAGYVQGRYVQNEPKAADVNFYLGVCKLLLGHPQESIAPLKQAVAAGTSPYLQSSHYYLAKAYLQQEKFEEAESELHDAAAISGRLTSDTKSLLARTQALRAQLDKK
jgi:hypothetical protein